MDTEMAVTTTRAITTLAKVMTPEQRRQAAEELRALSAEGAERRFLDSTATALEEFADDTD